MKKSVLVLLAAACLVLVNLGYAQPDFGGIVKIRVFEGLKEGSPASQAVTSSYLKYMLSANIPSDASLEAEQEQIKKTFNLKDVRLVTESRVKWNKEEWQKVHHMFRLDGKLYEVAIASKDIPSQQFRIEVNEPLEKDTKNLLDTVFAISGKNAAVFGFEDSNGKPYFISVREAAGAPGGVEAGLKPEEIENYVIGGDLGIQMEEPATKEKVEKKRQEFEKDTVTASKDDIKPPTLIKKVDPVYPEEARKNGIQGVVILEAKIDETGHVMDGLILRSVPALDQVAMDAVKQWVYEPVVIEGKPRKAVFTVTVRFQLGEKDIEKFAEGAAKVKGEIPPPKLVKKVEPVYPEEARKAGIQGVVILEARTDVQGKVKDVMVLRSVPALNKAAIDALRQWVYEPLIIDGKPREAVFTTTVVFNLDGEKKGRGEKEAAGTTGQVVSKIIKKVEPVYPEAARKAGVEGTILLEAKTDGQGDVVAVRVLKSIPELDQAASDALKQWKYEPYIVDGKPVGLVFTVTIRFALK
jgi:TonB family protein